MEGGGPECEDATIFQHDGTGPRANPFVSQDVILRLPGFAAVATDQRPSTVRKTFFAIGEYEPAISQFHQVSGDLVDARGGGEDLPGLAVVGRLGDDRVAEFLVSFVFVENAGEQSARFQDNRT